MCLPDLNGAAARKRWGGTGRWNRERLMRSAFGASWALAASVVETVWCGFGRRDALGGSWVSLALLACSQPRIAAEGAVRARRGHVCGLVRAG